MEAGYSVDITQYAYYVWPENWQSWEVFKLVSDQWLFSPTGGIIGLNSLAVWPVLNALGLGIETYEDVRVIASGVLKALKQQRDNIEE